MTKITQFVLPFALVGLVGCSSETTVTPTVDAGPSTIYTRVGGAAGVRAVVTDFVGRVVADNKINGYFLNRSVDSGRLTECLVKQIGNATGGPEVYDCKDMKAAHVGMGVSKADFDDLAGHLVASLTVKGAAQADIDAIVAVLTPMAADIVEDAMNNKTIYQRAGRKPAVQAVIDAFVTKVVADARINAFFAAPVDGARLKTCLVRQISSIDGPVKYGQEVSAETIEPGVSATKICRSMKDSHAGFMAAGGRTIAKADFDALVEDLVAVLDTTALAPADKAALLGVLGPMCKDIVKDGTGCP
ncbi:MAG: group 1 truncated hemoglobin [Polyangiaceae bacterium]|nr:group 1 truncated hemoglobin [Polyangiaceae bacterium]